MKANVYLHNCDDEAVQIAVNAYKTEMERINKARDQHEMEMLQDLAIKEARDFNEQISMYFNQIRESFKEAQANYNNLQNLERMFCQTEGEV